MTEGHQAESGLTTIVTTTTEAKLGPERRPDHAITPHIDGASSDHREARTGLELIAGGLNPITEEDIRKLAHQCNSERQEKWGKVQGAYEEKFKIWAGQMNDWWKELPADVKKDLLEVFSTLQIPTTDGAVDWRTLKDKFYPQDKPDINSVIGALNKIPGIRDKLVTVQQIVGIFGPDVGGELTQKLYTETTTERKTEGDDNHELIGRIRTRTADWRGNLDRRKEFVERRVKDPQKKAKFLEHIESQRDNPERIFNFNGVTFEGLTEGQRQQIIEAIKPLPPELIIHLKKIRILVGEEAEKKRGCAYYFAKGSFGKGEVAIKPESIGRADTDRLKLTMAHEIGGHGLIDMTRAVDRGAFREIITLWDRMLRENPGLLEKDTYSAGILQGNPYPDELRYGKALWASVDEFFSDRMAEYFCNRGKEEAQQIKDHRDPNRQFTLVEEGIIQQVCQQTEAIWRQALEKRGQTI